MSTENTSNAQTNGNKHPSYNMKVKLYSLNQDGNWNDCGAGFLSLQKEMNPSTEVEDHILRIEGENFNSTHLNEIIKGKSQSLKNQENTQIVTFKITEELECEK